MMAKIHAFEFGEGGVCRVVLHTAMPAGNNAVGNSWKSCWIASGRNVTGMTIGTGIGQISSTEAASIVAGDVIEISGHVPINIIAQGAAAVNVFTDAIIVGIKAKLASELNYFGWTNG